MTFIHFLWSGGAKLVSDKSEAELTSEGGVSGSETDGAVHATGDELSHAHIEYDPDPVIIEPEAAAPTSSKPNKKAKVISWYNVRTKNGCVALQALPIQLKLICME